MLKTNKLLNFIGIYLFFLSTLFFGLYFNEDFAGGAKYDFLIHKVAVEAFINNFNYAFLNYDQFGNDHSPIYILFLSLLIENNEMLGRIIYILISSLLPIIFFLILKTKFKANNLLLFFLSHLVLLSPYYRAVSIWPGDETISLILFSCSIYFYLKFKITNNFQKKLKFLLLNVFSLAITCYFRPVYCIFSIFFFYEFFINFNKKLFFYYIISNLVLSFPAFYYVFYLDVNFFKNAISEFNLINSFTLAYLTIFFYIIPFILILKNRIKFFDISYKQIILVLSSSFLVFFMFDYKLSTGGGFFYYLSKILMNNNLIIYAAFPFAFYLNNIFLKARELPNFILVFLLVILEIDGLFYAETYDPLLLILLFSLFKINLESYFFNNMVIKHTKILSIFVFFVLLLKITQSHLSLIIE